MADFKKALEKSLKWEGGISNHPADKGGLTAFGISSNMWPRWYGWEYVKRGDKWEESEALRMSVAAFYKSEFWDKVRGGEINNQSIAETLFDWQINSGYHAAKALQKVLGVAVDGIVGRQTIQAVNSGCQEQIFNQLKSLRIKFYTDIVTRNESQRVFLRGWLNRANSFTFY